MKKIIIYCSLLIAGINFSTNGQSIPPDNATADTCIFDTLNIALEIDTSQPGNIWLIGKPSKSAIDTAYKGTQTIITDSINFYPEDNHSSFTIALPHKDQPYHELTFYHIYETDSGNDGGYVEWSINGGEKWYNVTAFSGIGPVLINRQNFYSRGDTINGTEPGFSGISNGWVTSSLLWIHDPEVLIHSERDSRKLNFPGYPDTTWVRFTFISDPTYDGKDGWCIDNIIHQVYPGSLDLIKSNKPDGGIVIYPNPCVDVLNISRAYGYSKVIILNNCGETIFKSENSLASISTEFLTPGLYYL